MALVVVDDAVDDNNDLVFVAEDVQDLYCCRGLLPTSILFKGFSHKCY